MLFAGDAALASHSEDGLKQLLDRFCNSCDLFSLTISLKKTHVMGQATPSPPVMTLNGADLEVVHQFQYLGSTVTDTLSLDAEVNKRIGIWHTPPSQIISTLLYGST